MIGNLYNKFIELRSNHTSFYKENNRVLKYIEENPYLTKDIPILQKAVYEEKMHRISVLYIDHLIVKSKLNRITTIVIYIIKKTLFKDLKSKLKRCNRRFWEDADDHIEKLVKMWENKLTHATIAEDMYNIEKCSQELNKIQNRTKSFEAKKIIENIIETHNPKLFSKHYKKPYGLFYLK